MIKLLETALKEYGTCEFQDNFTNPRITNYFRETGFSLLNEKIDWCGVFILWCYLKSYHALPPESNKLIAARNWQHVGDHVDLPRLGDIAVFWREDLEDSWKGHVAIYINSVNNQYINVLGGNQKGFVNISSYPLNRILGYRRLTLS